MVLVLLYIPNLIVLWRTNNKLHVLHKTLSNEKDVGVGLQGKTLRYTTKERRLQAQSVLFSLHTASYYSEETQTQISHPNGSTRGKGQRKYLCTNARRQLRRDSKNEVGTEIYEKWRLGVEHGWHLDERHRNSTLSRSGSAGRILEKILQLWWDRDRLGLRRWLVVLREFQKLNTTFRVNSRSAIQVAPLP